MSENVISLRNVTKIFSDFPVLHELTFDIKRGSITTLLGFSGAGKSTLLKHILGLLKPTSGDVIVLGQNVVALEGTALKEFRQNFGMLFQYAALFDSLTTFENVAFPIREFTDFTEEQVEQKVSELLTSVNLSDKTYYKLPSELSGGMRKRVGLARALALQPAIMLYDEPTTGLDPITTKMVNELIVQTAKNNRARKMTSVIISHDIKATLQISDYIAFLHRGRVVEYLPSAEFKKSSNPLVREFVDL
ncbi:MAG: ATP-binding cassette domain-containing protein [Bacteriovoracaceae bacterium]|nr:ATP-binding cassette domain-containing protein [Bacteriovoracaceae bacterium]